MDNDSVARFLPEDDVRKRKCFRPGRRFFAIINLLGFITLAILFGVVLGISVTNMSRYESLKKQNNDPRTEGKTGFNRESNIALIDNRINKSEFSWRRKVDARFGALDNNLRVQVKTDAKLGYHMNSSFGKVASDIDNLITTVDNLTLSLLRLNSSSDQKIIHLRNILTAIKGDLKQTRSAMTRLNESIRSDLTHVSNSLTVAVKNLKNDIHNSTATKVKNLWAHWNHTVNEFEMAMEELERHNKSLHLRIEYQSDELGAEVKKIEKKLALLGNTTITETTKDRTKLENELNATRLSLKRIFRGEIIRANTSLYKAIENIANSLKSSLTTVYARVDAVKNQLKTNITNMNDKQKQIKDDLSKTNLNLQGVDRRHGSNISALAVKIQSQTDTYVRLRNNLDSEKDKRKDLEKELKDLRIIVNNLKNTANAGIFQTNALYLVVFLVYLLFSWLECETSPGNFFI